MKAFVAYYRVSTKRQDYGIGAQQEAVRKFLATQDDAQLLAGFEEYESGSNNDRPQLAAAIKCAKGNRATLVIGRLDRLSRNCAFLMVLRDSGLDFVCCDFPTADKLTIGILALVAERERELISERTRAGLQVAKARGIVLGGPKLAEARIVAERVKQERKMAFATSAIKVIRDIESTGVKSLNKLAQCLNKRGEKTPRGKSWNAMSVKRILLACS